MQLDLLPDRTAGAAENMATDFLLLQRYPEPTRARFRHYDWRGPAFTFGYGQRIAYVRSQLARLAPDQPLDLTRRPTGGGLVDHRDDWTFAFVIPRGHPLYDARATESYRRIHTELADALADQQQPVVLKTACEPATDGNTPCEPGPTVCFARPELYDVLHAPTGIKVAGAAQKRTKHGLLFQGSIARAPLPTINWESFTDAFTRRLAVMLSADAVATPWPDYAEGELDGLTAQYGTPEWIEYR